MFFARKNAAIPAVLLASIWSAPAFARDWYVSGAATVTMIKDPDSVIQNAPTSGATLAITNALDDTGWGGQLAIGHRFGVVRIEAEIGRTHTVARRYIVTSPISNDLPQTGGDTVTRFMANAYVDIPISGTGIRPYLGAGIGDAIVHVTTKASKPFGPPTAPTQLIDDKPNGFAWQAIAGIAVPLSPSVALTAQYRYFDAGTLNGKDTRGQDFRTRIHGSNVDLGVRLSF
jgi:opacity protein-like surface antigen